MAKPRNASGQDADGLFLRIYNKIGDKLFAENSNNSDRPIRRPDTSERTPVGAFMSRYFKYLDDPDKAVKYKSAGQGRKMYDNMIDDDPQLKSLITIRKLSVTSLKYEVVPYMERGAKEATDKAIQRADEIYVILQKLKTFDRTVKDMLNSYKYGFSVGEKMFQIDVNNNLIYMPEVRSRAVDLFKFDTDYNLLYIGNEKDEIMDKNKFLIHSFEPRNSNPYGTSLLLSCYWAHWFKTNMLKFLMLFAEKFGRPPIIGTYPAGWSAGQIDNLVDELEALQSTSVAAVEEGTVLDLLQSTRSEAQFIDAIRYLDSQMAKAIIGNTLTMDEGARAGSMALGKVHENVREDIKENDSEDVTEIFNDQIVDPLCYYNYGTADEAPRVRIPYKKPEDQVNSATYHRTLHDIGMDMSKEYLHKRFEVPKPEEGEEIYKGKSNDTSWRVGMPNPFEKRDDKDKDAKFGSKEWFSRMRGVRPPQHFTQYDIATSLNLYDPLFDLVQDVLAEVSVDLLRNVSIDTPMGGLIDQAVRYAYGDQFQYMFADILGDTVTDTASSFVTMFGLQDIEEQLSANTFQALRNKYLSQNFYNKGTVEGIRDNMAKLLKTKLPQWSEVGFDVKEMKKLLLNTFSDMRDWKAHLIAQTELLEAAHYAAFEMIQGTGMQFDAYFFVDPASCVLCQDQASKNPYSVEEARYLGVPHPQCNDQWSFVLKEPR